MAHGVDRHSEQRGVAQHQQLPSFRAGLRHHAVLKALHARRRGQRFRAGRGRLELGGEGGAERRADLPPYSPAGRGVAVVPLGAGADLLTPVRSGS
ncbi:hypothetical protein RB200_06270 [Streptomyces sp. PmtG]